MARTPVPPGPPPPHYRPPGAPRPPSGGSPLSAFGPSPAPDRPARGIGPGSAAALATATLVLGILIGFFLGRTYDGADDVGTAPVVTVPDRTTTSLRSGDTVPQSPPGPSTSTPPGTELEPSTIGSFENPIPVGQSYVLGLYEIEVLGADRDAAATLQRFDPANPAPPPEHRHVMVELEVRFTDPTGLGSPASIPFFVSDGSGRWFAFDSSCGRIPDDLAEAGFVEQGDELRGSVCFTVPTDAVDELVFGTEGFAGPLYFALPR